MAMKSSDRWLARFFHLFLTGLVLLIMFLKDTTLKQDLYNGHLFYVAFYLTLVSVGTVMYFVCSFMDPGFVTYNTIDAETGVIFNSKEEESQILTTSHDLESTETCSMLEKSARNLRLRRCGFCNIIQPLRAKHCEECKHCVRRYDHHCPWIGNCVGERNHKFFLFFLGVETCVVSWTVYITVHAFNRDLEWRKWFEHNWMYLILTIFLAVMLLVVALLWACHSYMMFTAQTTWEFMSRPRISYLKKFPTDYNPFDKGYIRNMLSFLCYFRIQEWDDVYEED
ncbi:palmitoyltransferase ZDHHC12-B-like [Hydractinia symbiolongicarpus]|uniref:palmitoyltransferase ZDHHC12-B-like n=1 Tax=Hydractinia symbiolongicarpus TaxID=13093 RepID=UPI00254C36BB|nr:palmitoyltransferase ZDHHC12-B-like [Hydractinia symbiolongicarpus]XP_057290330.1 palmitoyltransferase ZDHHC12-B-like [Hydractinia symbiolongicarpus]